MNTNPSGGESGGGGESYLGEIAQYVQALKDHDWEFSYTDDHSVYQRGHNSLAKIKRLQKQIDPDATLWNVTAPPAYRLHVLEGA